jgi:hypothetical protein
MEYLPWAHITDSKPKPFEFPDLTKLQINRSALDDIDFGDASYNYRFCRICCW